MRVLVFSSKYVPMIGGAEVFLGHLLPALQAAGHRVEVVTSARDDAHETSEMDGVVVHRLPLEGALIQKDLRATLTSQRSIAGLRRAFRPEVVHVHDIGAAGWFELRTRREARPPIALTLHTPLVVVPVSAESLVVTSLRDADRVVAVSEAVRRDAVRLAPDAEAKTVVIHPAVPAPVEDPAPVPLDPPLLVLVGRLTRQKAVDVALEAFAQVASRRGEPRLLVVGGGPEADDLHALARDLGVADRVEWLGPQAGSEVALALRRATLVLMPSRHEGFPLVALETAGAGRVVVGARTPGLDEVVQDDKTGVLVPVDDPTALADAIDALLADGDRIRALGRAARERLTTELSLDACVAAHDALYRSLVASRS